MNPYSRIKLAGVTLSGLSEEYGNRYGRLKDANARLARLKAATGDGSLWTRPMALTLQDTTGCNLRCPYCATHGTPETHAIYKKNLMDPDLFSAIVRKTFPFAYKVAPSVLGEPLTSPFFPHIADLALESGCQLDINTNGSRLDAAKLSLLLGRSQAIVVSMDGATPETFEIMRKGASFSDVCTNAARLAAAVRLIPATSWRPAIAARFTVMGSNIRDLPAMVRLVHRLGLGTLFCDFGEIYYPDQTPEDPRRHASLYAAMRGEAEEEARRLGVHLRLPDLGPPPDAEPGGFVFLPDGGHKARPDAPDATLPDPAAIREEALDVTAAALERLAEKIVALPAPPDWVKAEEIRLTTVWQEAYARHGDALERMAGDETVVDDCAFLDARLYISPQGRLNPCCGPAPSFAAMALDDPDTLEIAWNGTYYRSFVDNLQSGFMHPACRKCRFVRRVPRRVRIERLAQSAGMVLAPDDSV